MKKMYGVSKVSKVTCIASLVAVGLFALPAQSARIGFIFTEAIQAPTGTGVDLNQAGFEAERAEAFEIAKTLVGGTALTGSYKHVERLEAQGHTVNIYGSQTDDALGIEHMEENNDLIILTELPGSGDTGAFYSGANVPFISQESFILDDMGVTGAVTFDEDVLSRELRVVKEHPIVEGIANVDEVFMPMAPDPLAPEGVTFVGNFTTIVNENDNLFPENTVVSVVGGVSGGLDLVIEGEPPVIIAFEAGELFDNPARFVHLA